MAKKRVIAFFMHETERDAANREIQGGTLTDSYVMGEIDENRINALKADGLIIQELPPVPAPATLPLEEIHGVRRAVAHRNFMARAVGAVDIGVAAAGPAVGPDLSQPQYFFSGWKVRLSSNGVHN